MIAPTSSDIRSWSKVGFAELGFPQADPDPLDGLVERSIAFIVNVAGVNLAEIDDTEDPIANPRLYLAQQAVQMMVELNAFRAQGDAAETASDFDLLSSFDAGGYSEQRRPSAFARTLTPWPALNQLLGELSSRSGGIDSVPSVDSRKPSKMSWEPDWDVAKYIIDARKKKITYFGIYKPPWW